VDATLPIHDVLTMDDIVRDSLARERVGSMMSTCFAITALLMATLGIYGLVSYGVRQRTVEIGTRMALGADGRDILSLVIGGGLKLAVAGVVVGAAGAIAVASILTRFLDIPGIGWLPFAASTLIVTVVAIAASSFPAWRATRLSPMVAIRSL
jgi:ABC-type antimicrobial peptide transport system permease subunit